MSRSQFFYRQAGDAKAPTLILGHGYPTSSFMFRNLMEKLADKFHVIAPDFCGFGFTIVSGDYKYNFDNLAKSMEAFIDKLGVKKFGIYIFDYSAPVMMR